MLESTIQRNIIKYLNALPECIAENVSGTATNSGRPDINACWKGLLFRIEVKSAEHHNSATVVQKENLKKWGKAGAVAVVVYSLEEVKWLVSEKGVRCHSWKKSQCGKCPINIRGDCYGRKEE